jgi:hypothetical protein
VPGLPGASSIGWSDPNAYAHIDDRYDADSDRDPNIDDRYDADGHARQLPRRGYLVQENSECCSNLCSGARGVKVCQP